MTMTLTERPYAPSRLDPTWETGQDASPTPRDSSKSAVRGLNPCSPMTERATADPEVNQGHPGSPPSPPRLTVGSARCYCSGCGRWFGGVVTFDLHQRVARDGAPICLDDQTLRAAGLRLRGGWWVRAPPALARWRPG